MTETRNMALAAFPMPGSHERLLWTWCCSHQDAPLTVEQRAYLDELAARYREVREAMSDWTPRWPDAPLLPLDFRTGVETAASIVESESGPLIVDQRASGLALLDADPAAVVRELLRVHRTDEPNRWHYLAAAAALRKEGADVKPEARNTLAEALRAECCRLRLPEAAGLDELNAIATEAIERVSGEKLDDTRAKVRERPLYWWAEHDGLGHELRFTRSLARELHRRNRKLRPGMLAPLAAIILRSGVERPELASDGRLQHRADDGTTRAAAAAAQMHLAEKVLGDTAPPGVVPLAAYLATVCFEQHRLGQDEAQAKRVVIPSTNREMLRRFGIQTRDELRAALEWLNSLSIGDPRFDRWKCVNGHWAEGPKPSASTRGGRPAATGYVVDVGYPLAPFAAKRLADTFTAHGMAPPPSLGFYVPVLSVEAAPGAAPGSYAPTHRRQLDAYCMALPLVLTEKREEYAERGIKLDDLRAPLRAVGIYHRGNVSLFDNLCEVWRAAPQPDLFGHRTGPVLVPVEPNSDRFRLGPDYADADGMIVDAAGITERKRREGAKGRSVSMLRRTKGPG